MNTYRILAKPDIRKAVQVCPALGKGLLSQAIADVAIRELSEDRFGQVTVDVHLERSDHPEALNELTKVIEQSGYALVETLVTEWISAETQRVGFAAATFLVGSGATKNPLIGLAIGVGATLVAEEAGLLVDRVVAEFTANHDILGEWTLTRIPRATPSGDQAEAGFSVA